MPGLDHNNLIDDRVVYVIPLSSFFPPPFFIPFRFLPLFTVHAFPPAEEDSDKGQYHKMLLISTMSQKTVTSFLVVKDKKKMT